MSMIDKIATLINPYPFSLHARMVRLCIANGDSKEESVKVADWAYGKEMEDSRQIAANVLGALLEPEKEMLIAGAEARIYPSVHMGGPSHGAQKDAERIFKAMINAALEE